MTATALKRIGSVRVPSTPPTSAQGIWKSVLEGAARSAEFQNSTILVLGKKDVGKASLIRLLQRTGSGNRKLSAMEVYEESYGVSGLDYAYMNVRAVDDADLTESLAKCDIWILQDIQHAHLLTPLLQPSHLRHLIVLICLDMSEPWTLLEQLRSWFVFASDLLQELLKGLPFDEQEAVRLRLSKYTAGYRNKILGVSNIEEDNEVGY